MIGAVPFGGAPFGGVVGIIGAVPGIDTTPAIGIDNILVTHRVRLAGLVLHDILNDAPNTCSFTLEGEAPAVGQSVGVILGDEVYFAGAIQTVDQAYESKPALKAWHVTAIDDTALANARRPFGTWVQTSATTIAHYLTANFALGFSSAGVAPGLPPVSIVFDGADTLIAALARLANAIGGYTKIEQKVVYLFLEDLTKQPAPLDDDHRFLANPPIQMNTDASQLRTRVYGKGYGETVAADLAAGETMWPIQDGANFPPLGGTAIAGLTMDGAQSEKIAFTGTVLKTGGSLVGPGSSPTSAPLVQLQGGGAMTPGTHSISVAYQTAVGRSLAGPPATVITGTHPAPAAAPLADVPGAGTGPDEGAHDYAVSFVTAYGETVPGPVSNTVNTSASAGALPPPNSSGIGGTFLVGAGLDEGVHDYRTTFVNSKGETDAGTSSGHFTPGLTDPVVPAQIQGTVPGTTGGNLTPGTTVVYQVTFTTAAGESLSSGAISCTLGPGENAVNVPIPVHSDPRVTGRKLYRLTAETGPPAHLCATIGNNSAASHFDTASDASIAGNPGLPTVDTTTEPAARLAMIGIPTGPAGTTGRRLYRRFNGAGTFKQVTSITNNTETTFLDARPNALLGADLPTSNTTGSAVQRVPVSNIPIGPAGVTARRLYRRFNGTGARRLVVELTNNTATAYTDGVPNASLGAAALGTATAIGNQVQVTLPIGPAAVTAREVYLSPATDGIRRFVGFFGDNTTTTWTINFADAAIAGQPPEPTSDTSGLQQPAGQVNPGTTVLPVASPAPFRPGGGWVILGGGQVVRHTGISGNTLTGIPASGPGAITTAVTYGSQAIPSPMLIGVTGMAFAMQKGSAVAIWVQRDDLLAQQEHAARTGGDGIVEFLIVDQRRGVESLTARCDADLELFSRPIITVTYATRDLRTKSGKPIAFNLPSQGIVQTLTIQDVTITEIGIAPGLHPRFTVKASSVRFSLEDTLRRLIAIGPVTANA